MCYFINILIENHLSSKLVSQFSKLSIFLNFIFAQKSPTCKKKWNFEKYLLIYLPILVELF